MDIEIPTTEFLMYRRLPKNERLVGSEVESLIKKFEAHEAGEQQFLQGYKDMADKSKNGLVKFLLQLIISDEEKHHALAHTMVSSLKDSLIWSKSDEAVSSIGDISQGKDELLELTSDFIKYEKQGINEYKTLIKETRGYFYDIFVLILRSMIYDSRKHIDILNYIQRTLKEV